MKDKIFIDANLIISALDDKSIFHLKAKDILSDLFVLKECVFSPYVINEIHYFYHRNYNLAKAKSVIYRLMDLEIGLVDFKFNNADISRIINISSEYNLRAFDAYHSYYCKRLKIKQIATFDADFERIPWLKIYK